MQRDLEVYKSPISRAGFSWSRESPLNPALLHRCRTQKQKLTGKARIGRRRGRSIPRSGDTASHRHRVGTEAGRYSWSGVVAEVGRGSVLSGEGCSCSGCLMMMMMMMLVVVMKSVMMRTAAAAAAAGWAAHAAVERRRSRNRTVVVLLASLC